ncbi:VOC family protein [Paracoccus sp. (in: a-proteobacteria)]|uniref:VOC family protein n=1 Tax=Paracoccus sp. TaxID=267 RepID=UPI00396D0168
MDHGKPGWFELTTSAGQLKAAGAFYSRVLGWQIADAGMEGFTYHLAAHGTDRVAGLMETADDLPPYWLVYFDVDDIDDALSRIHASGGQVHHGPDQIPGTGRFAVAADPQGAVFGLLEPAPMDSQPAEDQGA